MFAFAVVLLAGSFCAGEVTMGIMCAARREDDRKRMARRIEREIRRQDRLKIRAIDRFNADRLRRLADQTFNERRGE